MLLLAGTYLSTFSETISYGAKGDRPAGSFDKVEVYVLDTQGRPHTLGLPKDFDTKALPPAGAQIVVGVRVSVYRGEVQINVERVLGPDQVRQALGQASPVRAAG